MTDESQTRMRVSTALCAEDGQWMDGKWQMSRGLMVITEVSCSADGVRAFSHIRGYVTLHTPASLA